MIHALDLYLYIYIYYQDINKTLISVALEENLFFFAFFLWSAIIPFFYFSHLLISSVSLWKIKNKFAVKMNF